MGRFRVITLHSSLTGSRSRYVGRRFPDSGANPYGMDKKSAALMAHAQSDMERAQRSWPEPPPSRLGEHAELRGERFRRAEDHWAASRPDRALPLYEEELAAHEAVLAADDLATLQLRQRVAEAWLALGRPVEALALLEQTHAHLARVLGPLHTDSTRASQDLTNARAQLGKLGTSADQAAALKTELARLTRALGADHPQALRTACALGDALQFSAVVAALDVLRDTLTRSERILGADHPDTGHVRNVLIRVCEWAEHRAKRKEVRAATLAREQVHSHRTP